MSWWHSKVISAGTRLSNIINCMYLRDDAELTSFDIFQHEHMGMIISYNFYIAFFLFQLISLCHMSKISFNCGIFPLVHNTPTRKEIYLSSKSFKNAFTVNIAFLFFINAFIEQSFFTSSLSQYERIAFVQTHGM